MCIAAIAWQLFADKPLVLLSNRDEFFARPTAALQHWRSGTVAGQDLRSGGTWLGVRQVNQPSGQTDTRWAIVLNFRDAAQTTPLNPTSRGQLVTEFLHSTLSPLAFARGLALADYDGFNLVLGTRKQAVMLNNRGYGIEVLPAGLYVLSNGQPNASWFKCERLRGRVRQEVLPLIAEQQNWQEAAWAVLHDDVCASCDDLPNTGVKPVIEAALSSIFIPKARATAALKAAYGTRVSNILTLSPTGFEFAERHTTDGSIRRITG